MCWKILILALAWNRVISLPSETCCPTEESAPNSGYSAPEEIPEWYTDSNEIAASEKNDVDDRSFLNPFDQVFRAGSNTAELATCDESCCRKKSSGGGSRAKRASDLVRVKRFPAHLDPLFQYRFLSRSGRKYNSFKYIGVN